MLHFLGLLSKLSFLMRQVKFLNLNLKLNLALAEKTVTYKTAISI